jgi:2-succinyl-6-hydroxy-2,4-cyclohexadiene-1-carboxylate synthase
MSGLMIDGLRWEVRVRGSGDPLLLIHGFTGRGTAWGSHAAVLARSFRTIVVDLPGHGRTGIHADLARIGVEGTADDLAVILERLDAVPAHVLGYSLGARVALRLAVAHPDVVARLVLESPSAGIARAGERSSRRRADAALAAAIERDGIEAFVDAWERRPVFASQATLPARRAARIRRLRLGNRGAGLAASLRAAGQGAMAPLHDRLAAVRAPTLVIAGALDPAGRARAETVASGVPGARVAILDGAGHTPHEERPLRFRRLALDFLQEDPAA